jgi:hypothetical protein
METKTIGYLGRIDRLFGASATTRNRTPNRAIVGITKGCWSGQVDLNHRPHGPEPCALNQAELCPERERTRILGAFRSPVNDSPSRFIPQKRKAIPVETTSGFTSICALEPVPRNVTRECVSIGV